MQHWKKLGLLYCPCPNKSKALVTHASNPTIIRLQADQFQVYFSSRDYDNRSHIYTILLEFDSFGARVVKDSVVEVLQCGDIGYFDDSGVTITALIKRDSLIYLYYLGWNLCKTIPFRNSIGLAISSDQGKTFTRYSKAPIIDRNSTDPISISYPFLMFERNKYRIWYGSCEEWSGDSVKDYIFSIKYAESLDGISWDRNGLYSIRCNRDDEDAIARPHVLKDHNLYKMWYSKKKGKNYSLGYAESLDGYIWSRLDSAIEMSESDSDWDSEMICYPCIFDHNGKRYMLYNGNGYGKTGFGLAVQIKV